MLTADRLASLILSFTCLTAPLPTTAQSFPSKPLRFIVPNSPGTGLDLIARAMGPEMARSLGQPVIVENKPGAGMMIGFEYVAKQVPPDGYTLLSGTVGGLAILPATVKDLRFLPVTDLPPVIGIAEGRYFLGSSTQLPWKTFDEMITYARANPDKLNYGSAAASSRLPMEVVIQDGGRDPKYRYQGRAHSV